MTSTASLTRDTAGFTGYGTGGSPTSTAGTPFSAVLSNQISARGTGGVSAAGGTAPANRIAAAGGGNPNPLAPDAWVFGVSSGRITKNVFNLGVFSTSPSLNPFDKNASLFVSKPLTAHQSIPPLGWPGATGGVATYNFAKNRLEPGYGVSGVLDVGVTDVLGFVNVRAGVPLLDEHGNVRPHFNGVVSANAGVAFQLNQPAGEALAGLGLLAPETPLGAGAISLGLASEKSANIANVWAGIGYRVELHFKDGGLDGIYYKGKRIVDLGAFLRQAYEGRTRYRPPNPPNYGSRSVAALNYTTQEIFGTSPWDLSRTSGGLNQGNGAVAVANQWTKAIAEYGRPNLQSLPSDVQLTVLRGPQNNAEAANAANAILKTLEPKQAAAFAARLGNSYNIDLGVLDVKLQNEVFRAPFTAKPDDYQFVRQVFQGDHRYPGDNPAPQPPPGGLRL